MLNSNCGFINLKRLIKLPTVALLIYKKSNKKIIGNFAANSIFVGLNFPSPLTISKLTLYFCLFFFYWGLHVNNGQNLITKLVIVLGYNLTWYLFIRGEFWQTHHWITSSSYILHVCKISKKLKINSYVINKLFKLQVFIV